MKEKIDNNEKSVEQYDVIGERYLKEKQNFFSATPDLAKRALVEYLATLKDQEGVDVGCGGGSELLEYRKLGLKNITGVDPSELMVKAARDLLQDEHIQLGKWTSLPFADQSQDFLVGRFSLHYEENLDAAYTEAARVLKPGGSLVLTLPHPDSEDTTVGTDGKEYVHLSLFNGKIPLTYPRHAMKDYVSPLFNNYFELIKLTEYTSPERETRGVDAFVLIARKKIKI